jgi:predicted transcriptional regulator
VTQKVALALLLLEQGSVEEISEETKLSIANTQVILDKLIEIGFIGQKTEDDNSIYFCTI